MCILQKCFGVRGLLSNKHTINYTLALVGGLLAYFALEFQVLGSQNVFTE